VEKKKKKRKKKEGILLGLENGPARGGSETTEPQRVFESGFPIPLRGDDDDKTAGKDLKRTIFGK